jgi:predicted N-acetyltransferase YhbS
VVGYISLREQVDADFGRARQRAVLRRLGARLRSDPASDRLLCFEEVRKKSGALNWVCLGRRVVPAQRIAGSVGRCSDFDGAFLPAKAGVKARWKRMDRAFFRDEELPPVSLYKIGGSYFVVDGNHRVSVARYHGIEWIDAQVTEFRVPPPVQPAGAGPFAKSKGHTRPDEPPERGDSKMNATTDPQESIEVRWGLHEDEARIAELLVLNGISSRVAAMESFIVAERDGRVVAALRYETEPKKLVLGSLVVDPWAGKAVLAKALYSEVHTLAKEMGVREVVAPSNRYGDYLYEAGYRRAIGGWSLDTVRPLRAGKEIPAGGWRRMFALLDVPAVPFFRPFRGARGRMDGSRCKDSAFGCQETESKQSFDKSSEKDRRDER